MTTPDSLYDRFLGLSKETLVNVTVPALEEINYSNNRNFAECLAIAMNAEFKKDDNGNTGIRLPKAKAKAIEKTYR